VRRAARGGAADAAGAEEESARPFFWQDERAVVQRQHIFVHHGVDAEGELADARSMGSLGRPSALFLMEDTEAPFMERLEEAAAAARGRCGRGRLEGVKLRDLTRCGAAVAAAEVAEAKAAK
jgi:hypothetical protein